MSSEEAVVAIFTRVYGFTALLLPAQNHTPFMTPYETRSMRDLAALRMVWASEARVHTSKIIASKKTPIVSMPQDPPPMCSGFLGSGCIILASYEHIFYERRLDHEST